jgi:hypothetical protein
MKVRYLSRKRKEDGRNLTIKAKLLSVRKVYKIRRYLMGKETVDFQIESFLFRKSLQFPDLDQVARSVTHP